MKESSWESRMGSLIAPMNILNSPLCGRPLASLCIVLAPPIGNVSLVRAQCDCPAAAHIGHQTEEVRHLGHEECRVWFSHTMYEQRQRRQCNVTLGRAV